MDAELWRILRETDDPVQMDSEVLEARCVDPGGASFTGDPGTFAAATTWCAFHQRRSRVVTFWCLRWTRSRIGLQFGGASFTGGPGSGAAFFQGKATAPKMFLLPRVFYEPAAALFSRRMSRRRQDSVLARRMLRNEFALLQQLRQAPSKVVSKFEGHTKNRSPVDSRKV